MAAERLDAEIRRDQIIQAAMDLVATHGIKGLTVTKVAEMVGVVPSALYKHFKNKGKIIDVLLDLIEARMQVLLKDTKEKSGTELEFFRRLYFAEVAIVFQFSAAPVIFFSSEVLGGKTVRRSRLKQIAQRFFGELVKIIEKGQVSGAFRKDIAAKNLALFFVGITDQITMPTQFLEGEVNLRQHSEIAWNSFVEAVQPR